MKHVLWLLTLCACSTEPRVSTLTRRDAQTAPDFVLYGEVGDQGPAGAKGSAGVVGSGAARTGTQRTCGANALGIDSRGGQVDADCVAGATTQTVIMGGTTSGNVGGTYSGDAAATPATLVVTNGAPAVAAAIIENTSTTPALRVVGRADFSAATRVDLPLIWRRAECNDCTQVVSACLAGEQLISGNCFITSQGDQIMQDHCPTFDGTTCQQAGNIMRCSMASTAPIGSELRAYAHCLRIN